jgi:hypothetical protein
MYDANALRKSEEAIETLRATGVISARQAKAARLALIRKLEEAISYWGDKGQDDIVDGLNEAYRDVYIVYRNT